MIRKLNQGLGARGDWSHFQRHWGSWSAGIIFSDGTKAGQMAPSSVVSAAHYWPVLFTHAADEGTADPQLITWCQDQAIIGAKPWRAHPSRVVRLRGATAEMNGTTSTSEPLCGCRLCGGINGEQEPSSNAIVSTPGPTFSEVDSDEDSTSTTGSDAWVVL